MIDQADSRVRDWVKKQAGLSELELTLKPPGHSESPEGTSLYLLEIAPAPQYRNTHRPPLVVTLRYLVTTWAGDHETAHRRLGTLLFAAMQSPDFQVDLTPTTAEVWRGFGVPPQPSFILSTLCAIELPEKEAPLVQEPVVVEVTPFLNLSGQVLGPRDMPIAGAVVEDPHVGRQARTDKDGRFTLTHLPGGHRDLQLIIHAKGKQQPVTVPDDKKDQPLIIHFQGLE